MERKKPFRLLALLAVFTAFMLAVMPTPAWAEPFEGWTYTEPTSGTKIEIESDIVTPPAQPQKLNVVVNLDGEQVYSAQVTNIPRSSTRLKIDLGDGYDVRTEASGDVGIQGSDEVAGPWTLSFPKAEGEGTLTINLLSNRIVTQWGTLNFKNATADGYNLTVRLYVNGSRVYTSPQLRVAGSTPNGLKITDLPEGLHFISVGDGAQNPYDFHTASGTPSWDNTSGTLTFGGVLDADRNHNNTLDIYLFTFDEFVNLDVDRAAGDVSEYMNGYNVSYTIDDVDYSYNVTYLGSDQTQVIPKNVPVTITALCKSGWEVTDWSLVNMTNTGLESNGNSCVLTTDRVDGTYVHVRAEHICPMPEKPTFEEVEKIFGDELVTVDCVNATIDPEHEDKTYGPIAGGVEIGDVVNNNGTYIATLTVTAPTYVGKYSSDVQVAHMLADGANDTHEVVLTYKDGKWRKANNFSLVVFKVMCSEVQDPKPELPTQEELAQLTGAKVKVTCVTENNGHGSEEYAPIAGAYSFPKGVEGDAEQGYTATMDVNAAAYVDEFSTDDRGEHDLAAGEADTKSVVLTYVTDADGQGSWQLAGGETPINFDVVCVVEPEPEPEGPDTPGKDVLDELFGDQFVTVDCVNDNAGHADKSYGLVDGAYTVHHEKDATTATVVVSPHAYVNKYENEPDIDKAHELEASSPVSTTFNLKYENGAWAINGANSVTYRVACADDAPVVPEQPTYDEILEATPQGAVTIDCTNAEVEHENKTYDIEKGAYTLGAVNDADGDGIYTVDVQVSAGTYVLKFENDHEGIHHYLDPADQGAKTITLAYNEATDSWSVADDSASPVTFTVLCDVEGTTDPGTDPDEPGTDPDEPGDEGDEPGTNPDDKPGDDGQGDKPGDQGGNGDQNKGDGANNGSGNGKLSQTGDVAALVAAMVAGAGALTAGAGYVAKRRK